MLARGLPEAACVRSLHQRLQAFDTDLLFNLHYSLITMGKVLPCCSLLGSGSKVPSV